jgi:pyruvate formate lyase activating enzyme
MNTLGLIFDIKRYSINDGPGIRVTVFFKGCPLTCAWCHNPESQSSEVQKFYSANKCLGCKSCVDACPLQALTFDKQKGIVTDFTICNMCGICAEVCPSKAMEMCGYSRSVEEIMETIRKDKVVMETSGGGVTFSGGEPLQHPELLIKLLKTCKKEGVHTAVDTAGFVDTNIVLEVAKHADLFLYDLKLMDSALHQKYTGVPNEMILKNLKKLAESGSNIMIRIPLIDGVNADEANITAIASFISSLPGGPRLISLLPYHGTASRKYEKMGELYEPRNMKEPDHETITHCRGIFEKHGIITNVGG